MCATGVTYSMLYGDPAAVPPITWATLTQSSVACRKLLTFDFGDELVGVRAGRRLSRQGRRAGTPILGVVSRAAVDERARELPDQPPLTLHAPRC